MHETNEKRSNYKLIQVIAKIMLTEIYVTRYVLNLTNFTTFIFSAYLCHLFIKNSR